MNQELFYVLFLLLQVKIPSFLCDGSINLKMPKSKPEVEDSYYCTSHKLDKEIDIIRFEPNASAETAHHILIYGCSTPGSSEGLYSCGSMARNALSFIWPTFPCGSGSQVVYAWAKDAPNLILPEGVSFKAGGRNEVQYLVLQVHYASVDQIPEEGDESGVNVIYTEDPQPRSAGVIYTSTGGWIPSGSETWMDAACTLSENQVIHPFAFRVHTHELGIVVSGYKVENQGDKWTLLGKESPQIPQMFYNTSQTTMTKGDVLASRCTMRNNKDYAVWVGSTKNNEMCNFYLMYWVEDNKILSQKSCTTFGPPLYSWDGWLFGSNLKNIPEDSNQL